MFKLIIIMKKLFESWRKHLEEGDVVPIKPGIQQEGAPKVECHCECHDCIFNGKNYKCVAEKIELDFAQTIEGKWICECKTYQVGEDEAPGPEIDADEEEEIRARRSPPGGDPVLEES